MIGRRLIVHGHVQGVFYRNWTVETARGLRVTGWVRNRRSGEVEILVCGAPEAIDALIDLCRSGPPAASVTRIDVEETEVEPFATFEKQPTA